MIVTLDTNAYSEWRRAGIWRETLAMADRIFIPSIVIGELDFGFRNGTRYQENYRKLEEFFDQPQVEEWVVSGKEARIYGELVQQLTVSGKPIPSNDIWIAACNVAAGSILLTNDRHFENLPHLRVQWAEA